MRSENQEEVKEPLQTDQEPARKSAGFDENYVNNIVKVSTKRLSPFAKTKEELYNILKIDG